MYFKIFILNILIMSSCLKMISGQEPVSLQELEDLADTRLKLYIKRLHLIQEIKQRDLDYIEPRFQNELDLLAATFKMALENHTLKEKENFLKHFPILIPPYFGDFLMDELDLQYLNQIIRLDLAYLGHMTYDLHTKGLVNEIYNLDLKLREALYEEGLPEKMEMYRNITDGLAPELKFILDRKPTHMIVLKAHLKFLAEFVHSIPESEWGDFAKEFHNLLQLLEFAEDHSETKFKLKVLAIFDDTSNKFGRFLKMKLEEYKFKYYKE